MTFSKIGLTFLGVFSTVISIAQQYKVAGIVRAGSEPVSGVTIIVEPGGIKTISDDNGSFRLGEVSAGSYKLIAIRLTDTVTALVQVINKSVKVDINLIKQKEKELKGVTVNAKKSNLVSGKLWDVSGTAINAGKKTELISLKNINANLATNNTRQIYARVPGLNIWEYDRSGLQLGIGGRGLSPNRSSNFNVRQNGYDISADALGYPESLLCGKDQKIKRSNSQQETQSVPGILPTPLTASAEQY
jgi:Fe(3+) dicitrate transport protein